MPPKSIFRQPGAKHFQLVHRSLRDPLIHDPEASKHVLKEFDRPNEKKGKSRAELEQDLSASDLAHDKSRSNIGEAAAYGIYYDDTEYDYMQHLRSVSAQEGGVDSVLMEAPSSLKGKGIAMDPLTLIDIPAEALPSTSEIPGNYESQQAVPTSISGFQPDMDPHLRQVLEALEDDEFVEDVLEEDFFGELVAGGERAADEDVDFEFAEEGIDESVGEEHKEEDGGEKEGWEARFARFKREQGGADKALSDDGDYSDGGDTVGTLPQFSVIGGKKRRKGGSDASGYSMSSSSMFRNEGLTTLDERFDQVQREYDSDEEAQEEESDSDSAPELITSREDFDTMMNEFLDNYEIVGGKMQQVLAGDTPIDKLDTIRKTLGQAKIRDNLDDDVEEDILMPTDIDEEKDRWDCETILTTYSNLENHPRLILARRIKPTPKITLDSKTGLPIVGDTKVPRRNVEPIKKDEGPEHPVHVTITRPKNESKEDKKQRKQAVKAERQARRADKKVTKEQFSLEIKDQSKRLVVKEKTKMRKL